MGGGCNVYAHSGKKHLFTHNVGESREESSAPLLLWSSTGDTNNTVMFLEKYKGIPLYL